MEAFLPIGWRSFIQQENLQKRLHALALSKALGELLALSKKKL
jgi:hypothetical protein